AQNQSKKSYRGRERAEKNCASKFGHRRRNRLLIFLAVNSRLLIAAEDQDREIDAESDQDGAEADCNHAQSAEDKQSDRKRDEAGKQKRETHSEQRQPPSKADEENDSDEK